MKSDSFNGIIYFYQLIMNIQGDMFTSFFPLYLFLPSKFLTQKSNSWFVQVMHSHRQNHMLESNNVDVIYLDFAKALDKVDHGIY